MTIQASDWLLTPIQWRQMGSNGKPWGTNTKMNKRAQVTNEPWDTSCQVTPLLGGYRAMLAMRKVLEDLIAATGAATAPPPGQRGHVYIADWRLNALRDLSDGNRWKAGPWTKETVPADLDQTAVGLVLRLMQAGVIVRILVWFPTPLQSHFADLGAHIADHQYLSDVVKQENVRLEQHLQLGTPLGIVGLDARTTEGAVSGGHHQKMMVVRSPLAAEFNVAFCGGVDLAFTRRDAPTDPSTYDPTKPAFLDGDWQSGSGIPGVRPVFANPASVSASMLWPPDGTTNYSSLLGVSIPGTASGSDLPMQTDDNEDVCLAVGGQWDGAAGKCTYTDYTSSDASGKPSGTQTSTARPIYGRTSQLWHDQHLMLRGPIVSTLEWQFGERWIDRANPCIKTADPVANRLLAKEKYRGDVLFSTDEAKSNGHVIALPDPQDEGVVGNSTVQMWRTIPMRNSRVPAAAKPPPSGNPPAPGNPPPAVLFDDGEFTVMSGYAKAMSAARQLIWIFDQYFWSEAAARLLNYRVRQQQGLCVILVLPPFADEQYQTIHLARTLALQALMHGLDAGQKGRIGVYNLWKPKAAGGRGIYVHAKAHTYDGALLVCGSANLNRRSLTCDSELACAVLDPDVVSQHQQNLWQLLFGTTAWPHLDLNVSGNGVQFFQQFKTAAGSPGACLVPDPWVDDIFADVAGTLPNGVARTTAFPGPVFEGIYAEGLDASSLVRAIEQDVMDAPGPQPRAPRLDDLATRVEKKAQVRPDGSVHYDFRKQGEILTGPIITFPAIVYWGPDGYEYSENAEWWRQVTLGLPCFREFPMHWEGYATNVVEAELGGQQVVIQLWKGWCERFALLRGMPGGVGAELGVYRRIPGKSLPDVLPRQLQGFGDALLTAYQTLTHTGPLDVWWPYPELNPTITFTLTISKDGHQLFTTGRENTWWACKWMTERSYVNKYQIDVPSAPSLVELLMPNGPDSLTLTYTIECTVNGQTQTLGPNVW